MEETKQVALPPVGMLFKQAWDLLISQMGRLVILWIYSVLIYSVAVISSLLLGGGFIFYSLPQGFQISDAPQLLSMISTPSFFIPVVVLIVAFVAVLIVIGLVYSASIIFLLHDEKKEKTPWTHFKNALPFAGPLFVTGMLAGFFATGGLFLFFLPYILIMVLFSFYTYVVVLEKKTGMEALRLSASMVYQNFWGILGRQVLLGVVYLLVYIGVSALFSGNENNESLGTILQMVLSSLLNMYMVAYTYILYQHARNVYISKPVSFAWIWIVAIVGWVIAAGIGVVGYYAVQAMQEKSIKMMYDNQKQLQDEQDELNQIIEEDSEMYYELFNDLEVDSNTI